MARVRTRIKRSLYLMIALAILFLLLQLNQWLPGSGAGGGSGGFRAAGELGAADPHRAGAPDAPVADAPDDPTTVEPPEQAPVDWPPKTGIRVEVRGPDGDLAEGWRLGVGDGGSEQARPNADGSCKTNDKRVFGAGFRIRTAAGLVRHRHGAAMRAARWSVYLPRGKLPLQVRRREVTIRVVDATSDNPLPDAHVDYEVGGLNATVTTDANGEAAVRTLSLTPLTVRVRKPGHETATISLSAQDPRQETVRLDPLRDVEVVYAPGSDAVLAARLRLADGSSIRGKVTPPGDGAGQRATFRLPHRKFASAWLESVVGAGAGRYLFRRPAKDLDSPITVPGSKRINVRVRDPMGRRIEHVRTHLDVQTYEGPQAEDEPRGGAVQDTLREGAPLLVARGARVRLRVDAPGAVPMVRSLTPIDGTDDLAFVAVPGIRIPVRVLDRAGHALSGAEVVARTSVEGERIRVSARTDAEGRAYLGPFGAGPVEVFAASEGRVPAALVAQASAAMGTLTFRLHPGAPLRIVVEDPFGRALQGVGIEIVPTGGKPPLVVPPGTPPRETDGQGLWTLKGVPAGDYDVTLTLTNHAPQTLRRVHPGAVTWFATLIRR